jgi:hypothetical protein
MLEIHQSIARRVLLKLYLASDHISAATGKTVAVVISKNGSAFANPSAGATNAVEIANGWYYVDLSITDTNTLGDLVVRGTNADSDPAERIFAVVDAVRRGMTSLPNAAAESAGGLYTRGTGAGQLSQTANGELGVVTLAKTLTTYTGNTPQTGNHTASIASILEDTGTTLPAAIAGISGGGSGGVAGPGADLVTLTINNLNGTPIPDADVWVSTDSAGLTVVAGTKQTNSDGEVTFLLDDGATYYLWVQKNGVVSIEGSQFVAEAG